MGFKVIVNETKVKFSACHFLKDHYKCSRLHGHNYYVSVEISDDLNEHQFVVDFMDLKKELRQIVDKLDHYVLVPTEDPEIELKKGEKEVEILVHNKCYVLPRGDICFLPLPATTSELLAKYIHDKLKKVFPEKTVAVKVGESKSSMALYEES
ncbi:MAG: 6-carboxytetrahydropterin synthase [Promethearchaeia archaeon]